MEISNKLAQTIVLEMKEIIGRDINYINTDGVIIASTNPERIGSFHEGAKRVGETKNNLIIQYDGEFSGAKEGVNLPVYFESSIVGVIGITGKSEEVERYGKILKRMTELLIKDAYANKLMSQKRETQRMLVEQLLFVNNEEELHRLFSRLTISNIDIKVPRLAVVAKTALEDPSIDQIDSIFHLLNEKLIKYFDNLIAPINNNIVLVLREISRDELHNLLSDVIGEIKEKHNLNIVFGIGTSVNDILSIKESFEKAHVALGWALRSKQAIKYYSELGLELIIEDVSSETSNKIIEQVIGNLSYEEMKEYKEIISLFEKYNGSIKKISELMFIHKNTLQYKLNRLYEKTGYDMRNFQDFLMLKIAFLLSSSPK